MAKKLKVPESPQELPIAIVKQMISLSTAGFGLVAALAWNEVVKSGIETFIKPYLPKGSQFFSLTLYAAIVTTLAVLITLQLTRIEHLLEVKKDDQDQASSPKSKKSKKK